MATNHPNAVVVANQDSDDRIADLRRIKTRLQQIGIHLTGGAAHSLTRVRGEVQRLTGEIEQMIEKHSAN